MEQRPFDQLSDRQIIEALGLQFDLLRRVKGIPDKTLIAEAGVHSESLNKFRQGSGNPTLATLIKILRGLGELERLEKLFSAGVAYSPTGKHQDIPAKRVRKKSNNPRPIAWQAK